MFQRNTENQRCQARKWRCPARIDAENLGERAFTTQFHNNLFRRKLIGRGSTSPRRFWRISLNIIWPSRHGSASFSVFRPSLPPPCAQSSAERMPHVVNAIGLSFLTDFRARFDKNIANNCNDRSPRGCFK